MRGTRRTHANMGRMRARPWSIARCNWRLATAALLGTICIVASGCAVVDYEQRRWIFMPTTQAWAPGVAAAAGMNEVWISFVSQHPEQRGQTVRLHSLWLPRPEPRAPTLLFLHGVRWDVRASALRLRRLHALGFSVLGIDYRGFGQSSAAMPSETLAAEDAHAAWAWLAAQAPARGRYIAGHSVGANIAVRLAAEVDDEAGLIVEGGFTSSADHFRSLRWGWLPITGLITQQFDAGSRIAAVGSPVLIVHGLDDTMIAPAMAHALYERARPPKQLLLVAGAVHEDTDERGHEQLRAAVQRLFGVGLEPGVEPEAGRAGQAGTAVAPAATPRAGGLGSWR